MKKLQLIPIFLMICAMTFANNEKNIDAQVISKISISDNVKAELIKSNENKIVFEVENSEDVKKYEIKVVEDALHVRKTENQGLFASLFGKEPKLKIYYNGNLQELNCNNQSELTVNEDILTENIKLNCANASQFIFKNLTAKSVALSCMNGSEITAQLKSDVVRLYVSTKSNAQLTIDAKELSTNSVNNSQLVLKGQAEKAQHKNSRNSKLYAAQLTSKSVNAVSKVDSKIELNVSEELNAEASSSARITYQGNPSNILKKEESNGSVGRS